MNNDDYYEILGVSKSATKDDIKKAYKDLARKWHPDKNPDKQEQASDMFKKISEAYDVLSDDKKRQIYDNCGKEAVRNGASSYSNEQAEQVFRQFFGAGFDDFGGFGSFSGISGFGGEGIRINISSGKHPSTTVFGMHDVFSDIFGRAGRTQIRVSPMIYELGLSLEEFYKGKKKTIKVTRKRVKGVSETKMIDVYVQPGMQEKTKFSFEGEGDEVQPNLFQDLIIVLIEKKHDIFKRENDKLIYNFEVSALDILEGKNINIKHLDDSNIQFDLSNIKNSKEFIEIEGKGFPISRNNKIKGYGNMIIIPHIVFPKLDIKKKNLIASINK